MEKFSIWIVRNFWQKVIVYMFSLIYLFGGIFTRSMFPIKLLCNIEDSNSYILFHDLLGPWLFAYMHLIEVQYSSQWLHYDNLRKIKNLSIT